MGHILLVILKFIGILLVSILGFVLFLILIILLGPVGYSAEGKKDLESISFQGKVSWLLAVLRCKVSYSEKGFSWSVRAFGILVAGNSEKMQQKKLQKLEKEERKKASQKTKKTEQTNRIKEVKKEADSDPKPLEKKIPKESQVLPEEKSSKKPEAPEKKKWNFKEKISKLKKVILGIPDRLTSVKENLLQKKEKAKQLHKFWLEETTQNARRKLIEEGKKIVLHILPNQFQGELEIGLEDPYTMGQVLAILGILMPLYQDKLLVRPDFEEEKLQGSFSLKGRIIPGYLLYKGLCLFFHKNIRKTIKEGKQLIGGN